jgi:prepilin-type N-terminal cleavage/methylation domain-containing protein
MISKRRTTLTNQDGVTLVEMLVVMGLLAAMLVLIATIFTSAADVQQQSNSYSSTLVSGRFILARLNYDIARATAVTTPASLGTTGTSLVMTVGGSTYSYTLSGTNLQLTDATGAANLNSADVTVSALSFQELGNTAGFPTILYSFTLTSTAKTHGVAVSQTFTSAETLY